MSGREWFRPLHRGEQIASRIGACVLHLKLLLHSALYDAQVQSPERRSLNECYLMRIQSFHYGACKWSPYSCASLYFFWAHYKVLCKLRKLRPEQAAPWG